MFNHELVLINYALHIWLKYKSKKNCIHFKYIIKQLNIILNIYQFIIKHELSLHLFNKIIIIILHKYKNEFTDMHKKGDNFIDK